MSGLAPWALRAIAVVMLGGGGVLVAACWAWWRSPRLCASLARHERALKRDLAFLRLPIDARRVLLAQAMALLFAAALAGIGCPLAASSLVVLPLAVRPWLGVRRARRVSALEAQLDGWLAHLANTLGATPALSEAIAYSVTLTSAPLADELDLLTREVALGTPLDEALGRFSARVQSRTVESALSALRIGRRTGGDLPAILRRSAKALREMARLEGVVREKTAEGKAQAFVVAAIPFPMVALLHFLDPAMLRPLVASLRGWLVLALALSLWGAAIALARKVLDVDI